MHRDTLYKILRPWVEYATRCHYASVTIRGQERLPQDGGYIIAPCHQNAMMEPLLILLLTRRPIYHICRGDIFENPSLARIFEFLKIFPIYRRRDGLKTLSRNEATFQRSRQVLVDGYPLSIMPEGQHNNRHQLLPLVKGVFRIALQTQRQMGDTPLYIVPLGIDLDYYERPYSHAVLNIGEPIDIRQYMAAAETDEPTTLNVMRDQLTVSLKAVMHNIDSRQYYTEFADLCTILNKEERQRLGLKNTPFNRFVARQHIARRLDALEQAADQTDSSSAENQQTAADQLNTLLDLARQKRALAESRNTTIERIAEPPTFSSRLLRIILLLALAALLVPSLSRHIVLQLLACYPLPLIPTHLIVRHTIEDTQFRSSINFGIRLLIAIIYIIALFITVALTQNVLYAVAAVAASLLLARILPHLLDWFRRGL